MSEISWPERLTAWYRQNARPLPWRSDRDPYHVWISEIMLQQTRIEAVTGYYARFLEAFPTVEALASAPLGDVLKLWEGLGYYSRARNLHRAAGQIVQNGSFPRTAEQIRALAGVGDYTAAAIGSIAFDLPMAAVDGNVMRVISRLYAWEDNVMEPAARRRITELVQSLMPQTAEGEHTPSVFTQALMELGEVVCLPKSPRCGECPLRHDCEALGQGKTAELPVRIPRKKVMSQHLMVAVALRLSPQGHKQMLMLRRPESGMLGGMWEYPNAELTADEAAKLMSFAVIAAMDGEAREHVASAFEKAFGTWLRPAEGPDLYLGEVRHVFTHREWRMHVFLASAPMDPPEGEFQWVDVENPGAAIPTAFQKIRKLIL